MKYKLIYTFSFLILCYIWLMPNYEVGQSEKYIQLDSAIVTPSDSTYVVETNPTIVYIEKNEQKGFFGTSNEIITLIVGVGNIITMYYQFKKK